MTDSPYLYKRADFQNVTGFDKKRLLSSLFTKKPFCRSVDAAPCRTVFLCIMPKFENPCNKWAVHVMYCIGAVKKKMAGVAV